MAKFVSTVELDLVNDSSLFVESEFATQQIIRQTTSIFELRIGDTYVVLQGDFTRGLNSTASYARVYKNDTQYVEIDDFNVNLIDFLQSFEELGAQGLEKDFFSGADQFFGSSFDDNISSFGGADVIFGNSGNDTLTGGAGNDEIKGGEGTDTAVYSGDQNRYTLTLSPTSTKVTDRRSDGNGTDEIIDMEFLDFASGDLDLNQFGGTTGLSEENFESFIELYIAYFNRAPDAIGLNFWGTQFANGTSLEEMAALFAPQDETLATYPPGTSNEDFATSVYNNVLGRDPDLDGFNFWVGQLDAGNFSRDQFILEVLGGVKDGTPDREYLDKKVDIGAYFAVHKGMSDVDDAVAAMAFFGDQDTSNTTGAVGAIDGYHADALDPDTGEFLMPLVGVLDDPFSAA